MVTSHRPLSRTTELVDFIPSTQSRPGVGGIHHGNFTPSTQSHHGVRELHTVHSVTPGVSGLHTVHSVTPRSQWTSYRPLSHALELVAFTMVTSHHPLSHTTESENFILSTQSHPGVSGLHTVHSVTPWSWWHSPW